MMKIAIIGASDFQNPLILKAKERGIETHVFAWAAGDIGEHTADFFYPISIIEKDKILDQCRIIGIDGIASIGSDLANITVAYVAKSLGLVANSIECVICSTDKHRMRRAFEEAGDPSPRSIMVDNFDDRAADGFAYPVIVKPVDRSGSRGIVKVERPSDLPAAISVARTESFGGGVLIEEFAEGREFSVEYLSWQGSHRFLAVTEKFTTGAPHFIEMGHLQPARIGIDDQARIRSVVEHALDTLGIQYGASHAEIKISDEGEINIIEIGSRMGGDCIGSDLVELSTGYDYVNAVIDVALGIEPLDCFVDGGCGAAAIRFVFSDEDIRVLSELKRDNPAFIRHVSSMGELEAPITDSSKRCGFFIFASDRLETIESYLPKSLERGRQV